MSDDWEADLAKSSERFIAHWPEIRDALGCVGPLEQIEGIDREFERRLDRDFGIDYTAQRKDGSRTSIAARAQGPRHPYASFTIRLSRITGTPTEWLKRKTSHRTGRLNPDWTVQIYVDRNENLLGYGAIRTRELLSFLDPPAGNCTVKGVEDGNRLMAVWWLWMRREGYDVATFGENKLRGPLNPWHVSMGEPCMRCWHQVGVHVKGRSLESQQDRGWAMYDRVWQNASGGCSIRDCECPSAYHPRDIDPVRVAEVSWLPICRACGYRLDPVLADLGFHVCCEVA